MTSTPLAAQAAHPPGEPHVPKRRNIEALLLVFALGIALFAYADTGKAMTGKTPPNLAALGAEFGITLLAAHLVVRRFAPYADPVLLPVASMINGLGLVLIYRLDPYNIANKLAPKAGAAPNQAIYTVLGMAVFIVLVIFLRDHRVLQRYAYISALVGLFLIALPAVLPASISEVNGARSWIRLGGFSVQPAEFGKLLLVSFFAAYLHAKRDALALASRRFLGLYLPRGRDLGPILVCWAFAMLILIRETDLGVSLMFFGAFVIILYMATERTSWLLFGLLLFVGGAAAVANMSSHVMVRVHAWLHPFSDVTGQTRQLAQSLYAFANGGLFGTGLGRGYSYQIGFANNADFMLATVGEELGLVGLTALFVAYAIIVVRGVKTALLVRDPYGKLFAAGLAATFALQVFITAGGVTRIIPLTGLPMPFLAYGGSALMANWILVALLIRISDAARRPLPPAIPLSDEMTQVVQA
ncbi:FtsW/RodA/SpoVE family cell cycle protein [Actinocrinis puniceicyclus]|uniref:FtsW/RodA/SpoVE family cell cycle protein n=1 Tax=Actinocrinis puniceicyclus TaxID=977794 RepID=A0A8J7WIR6_9ACTN|nr:FtsW/RodA/SpoVE family cell cycle protein [Actinocrinis puniceicyclus]MBS2962073.1 FtsW/RodA/SpoVE family cell cycle protein [Actinocrinis puniceicyclus]